MNQHAIAAHTFPADGSRMIMRAFGHVYRVSTAVLYADGAYTVELWRQTLKGTDYNRGGRVVLDYSDSTDMLLSLEMPLDHASDIIKVLTERALANARADAAEAPTPDDIDACTHGIVTGRCDLCYPYPPEAPEATAETFTSYTVEYPHVGTSDTVIVVDPYGATGACIATFGPITDSGYTVFADGDYGVMWEVDGLNATVYNRHGDALAEVYPTPQAPVTPEPVSLTLNASGARKLAERTGETEAEVRAAAERSGFSVEAPAVEDPRDHSTRLTTAQPEAPTTYGVNADGTTHYPPPASFTVSSLLTEAATLIARAVELCGTPSDLLSLQREAETCARFYEAPTAPETFPYVTVDAGLMGERTVCQSCHTEHYSARPVIGRPNLPDGACRECGN